MLTVGVFLYPAANRRIYTIALCYGIMYVIYIRMRNFIYHSVGFLHCPSQQQGQCEDLRLGMDEANPTFLFCRSLTIRTCNLLVWGSSE